MSGIVAGFFFYSRDIVIIYSMIGSMRDEAKKSKKGLLLK